MGVWSRAQWAGPERARTVVQVNTPCKYIMWGQRSVRGVKGCDPPPPPPPDSPSKFYTVEPKDTFGTRSFVERLSSLRGDFL